MMLLSVASVIFARLANLAFGMPTLSRYDCRSIFKNPFFEVFEPKIEKDDILVARITQFCYPSFESTLKVLDKIVNMGDEKHVKL